MTVSWLAESFDGDIVTARVGRDAESMVAEWPGLAKLSVRRDGTDVQFQPSASAAAVDIAKLQQGALPLLLAHLRGDIPLHASAIAIGGRAVVFLGGAGDGKSTLAAALCEREGASLLGDDAVVIVRSGDSFDVLALDESHWLDVPAARAVGRSAGGPFREGKAPFERRPRAADRVPLARVVTLAFDGREDSLIRLEAVSGCDAVAALLSQLTRFVVDEPHVARRDIDALAELIDQTPVLRFHRPRKLDLLAATARFVADNALSRTP